jgi:hypothetical protein
LGKAFTFLEYNGEEDHDELKRELLEKFLETGLDDY